LQLRQGPDGIDGTADDGQLDPKTAYIALGFPNGQALQITGLTLGLKNTFVFRVTSVGRSGNVTRTVQMIFTQASQGAGRPRVSSWKEL
jgi:hypothetical protein